MGRRTYASIPERFRPLPGRRNLVLSRDPSLALDGAEVFGSLEAALQAAGGDAFVIGGGATYAQALPVAGEVWATEIDAEVEGDTRFAPLDAAQWTCVQRGEAIAENGHEFRICRYERRA